jgi:hypothetical protein
MMSNLKERGNVRAKLLKRPSDVDPSDTVSNFPSP